LRAASSAAGSLSLRRPLRRREGGGTSGLVAWWVCGRVRVEGDAAEAVAVVSCRNKFLRAPFTVRRGFCLRLGASGVGDPRISSRSRAMVTGGPLALAVWVLRWAMDARRRRPFFFLVGMFCGCCSSPSSALMLVGDPALPGRMARPRCWTGRMTRVLFLPVVLDRSDDSSSLPSGRDTFRGTQSQRWRWLLQVCWIDVHALSALVSRKEEAAWRQLYRGRR
jgi:hypothetical protein